MEYDYKKIEKEIKQFWDKEKVVAGIVDFRKNSKRKKFYLLDGPPYANAPPHAGHAMTIAFKDIWGKFKFMQGRDVWFQAGFDCHGLPIENKVEAELKITSKPDIENKIGAKKFIETCKSFATTNLNEWMDYYKALGAWKGWVEPYLTYNNDYIESIWWTVKTLYEKGIMVKGEKPIHWCPHCQTALSGYEATDAYKDVEDPSIYMKFKIRGKENEYFLVWTTTPWTLPANVALVVHPDETYVRAKAGDEIFILAKALLKEVMSKGNVKDYKIVEEMKGAKLEGIKYEPLLDMPVQHSIKDRATAHAVIVSIPILKKTVGSKLAIKKGIDQADMKGDFSHMVTMDTGTGIVHCAPGHGAEDNKIGMHYNLPVLSPVDDEGKLTEGTGFEGIFVKKADPLIIEHLDERGKLFKSERIVHSYALCWRCKTPLVYRLSKQWFFKIDTIKEKMIKENKSIRWLPEFARSRMHNWLSDSEDWCISTNRYWGAPIPVWECRDCGTITVIGSKKELIEKMSNKVELNDLHKHVVDNVKIKCKECGSSMSRVPFIINIWVESGVGPWASLGYPYYDSGLFDKLWNVDLVNESQDQIRGWFYSLLFMSMATFGKKPYETACLNGWIVDEHGEKMSKSLGNIISAENALDDLGADVLRLYNCYTVAPWEGARKFSIKEAKELFRFMNTLLNISNLVKMYRFDAKKAHKKPAKLEVEDRWMLSRLNTMTEEVTEDLENFRVHFAGRKIVDLVLNDFSRWYLKIAKERSNGSDFKENSIYTIFTVLDSVIRLIAPICPFITEKIYQDIFVKIRKEKSVHLCSYPVPDRKMIDRKLEEEMRIVDNAVEISASLRQDAGIRLKWPIKSVTLSGSKIVRDTAKDLSELIAFLSNAKKVVFEDAKLEVTAKPNYASLGPAFGKDAPSVVKLILSQDASKLKKNIESGPVKIGGYTVDNSMVKFEEKVPEGITGKPFKDGAIYLDLTRDDALESESFAREVMRQIQVLRKEKGLDVSETVEVYITGNKSSLDSLLKFKSDIDRSTNSKTVFGAMKGKKKAEVELRDRKATVGI